MGVQRKSAAERRELVLRLMSERETTGETWRSIAARMGISHSTLTGWVWRLRRERASSECASKGRSQFVELVTRDETDPRGAFEVVLRGDRRLRIGAHFDEPALARLVRALEAC